MGILFYLNINTFRKKVIQPHCKILVTQKYTKNIFLFSALLQKVLIGIQTKPTLRVQNYKNSKNVKFLKEDYKCRKYNCFKYSAFTYVHLLYTFTQIFEVKRSHTII